MVVQSTSLDLTDLDLGHLSLFLGLRVNQLVMVQMARAGFRNLRESHGYLIQHLISSDRTITELARRMGVSQQAASKAVAELVRLGVLEESAGEDRRSRIIRLSRRGWKGVQASRETRSRIHQRVQKAIGKRDYDRARMTLIAALEKLGGAEEIRTRRVRPPS